MPELVVNEISQTLIEGAGNALSIQPIQTVLIPDDGGLEIVLNQNELVIEERAGLTVSSPKVELVYASEGPQGPKGDTGATGFGIPTGGTTGQVLRKASNADYDIEFGDASGAADASTTTKGISKLSVAPVSPTSPIAVGDNDERVSYRRGILFVQDGPVEGFASGAYKQTLPVDDPFPTQEIWWESAAMLKKIAHKTITYTDVFPTTEVLVIYAADGVTPLRTITDTIAYSGPFETTRTRSVS